MTKDKDGDKQQMYGNVRTSALLQYQQHTEQYQLRITRRELDNSVYD